jgi:hypothetical protein
MNVGGVDRQTVEESVQEAESRPLSFLPKERLVYIRDNIKSITHLMAIGSHINEITTHHAEFARDYPGLFKKVIEKQDLGPLKTMFAALEKMGTGDLSQHQASVIVGQKLVDKFVKPQLSGIAPDSKGH